MSPCNAYSFKELCALLDCKQAAALKRVMKARGIKWSIDRRGRPWTTQEQLNSAMEPKPHQLQFTKPPVNRGRRR